MMFKKEETLTGGIKLRLRPAGFCLRIFAHLSLCLSLLLMVAGCGEARVPVYKVAGKVTFEGAPPVGAQAVFHPDGHALPEGDSAVGTVKDDGSFEVNIYGDGGVPAGNYTATFQWFKMVESEGGAGRGPNVLPEKYADAATSPIKVTVKTESNVLDPIVIE